MSILYYSTNLKSEKISFPEALIKGLATDKGLYMPENIPIMPVATIKSLSGMPYYKIAYEVIRCFLNEEIDDNELYELCKDAYNFDIPLEHVADNKHVMRLDQGPTASFKDFAARMMGRLMQYYLKKAGRKMLILTATSGDTGSAIANAFYGLDNINVVVLYPEKEVTDRQRKQMTTLHKNIQIIALNAKFDDCQAMVKQAFSDSDLDYLDLSSANSINIGRLIPQSVYYFYAYASLVKQEGEEIVFSVPSGNFGNLMGGLLAKKMGLPIRKFIVSTNANDEVPTYLRTNVYKVISPSLDCISSAMNVGHPSNMARIIALYGGVMNEKGDIIEDPNTDALKNDIYGISVTDDATRAMIIHAYRKFNVLLEPHGAVAWAGLLSYNELLSESSKTNDLMVALETAHPAKFPSEINDILGIDPMLPKSLEGLDSKEERQIHLDNDYLAFKTWLMANYK